MLADLMKNLAGVLSPVHYVKGLGFAPFDWQVNALTSHKRLLLNCCRQAGKSTVIAAKAIHKARFYPGSLIMLVSPSERQSKELMKKVEDFMAKDADLPQLEIDNTLEKEFRNKSRILALPGSEKTIRGFSGPALIIIDEAARVEVPLYNAVRPMMAGANTELVLMSTPFGKTGFFFNAWEKGTRWVKIEVTGKDILNKWKSEKQYIAAREAEGIHACYSPRHAKDFLLEELESMGLWWYKQEYGGEFLESEDAVFTLDDIRAAITESVKPVMAENDIYADVGVLEL